MESPEGFTSNMYHVVYSKEYPYYTPSTLKFKSLNELIRVINFYMAASVNTLKGLLDDESRGSHSLSTFDLNWALNCYGVCYDNTHIFCSDDMFTFKYSNTLKLVYQHFIKIINRNLVKINKDISADMSNFDYSNNRQKDTKCYTLEKLKKVKKGESIDRIWVVRLCRFLDKGDPERWLKNLKITIEVLK